MQLLAGGPADHRPGNDQCQVRPDGGAGAADEALQAGMQAGSMQHAADSRQQAAGIWQQTADRRQQAVGSRQHVHASVSSPASQPASQLAS